MSNIRINKYIASCGICSRRKAEEYIKLGQVKINGIVVNDLSTLVCDGDKVEVNNKKIELETNKVYIMLNKPLGYVTTSKEQFGRPSVLDLVRLEERLFPVGRLDMYSEGLLLLTNDGDLMNAIIHPTKHVSKQYEVVVNKDITDEAIIKLEQGVDIGEYITKPARVKRKTKSSFIITIFEGKNRQIRRMCEALDYKVKSLKRIAIGNLHLENLKPGQYIKLSSADINKIFE